MATVQVVNTVENNIIEPTCILAFFRFIGINTLYTNHVYNKYILYEDFMRIILTNDANYSENVPIKPQSNYVFVNAKDRRTQFPEVYDREALRAFFMELLETMQGHKNKQSGISLNYASIYREVIDKKYNILDMFLDIDFFNNFYIPITMMHTVDYPIAPIHLRSKADEEVYYKRNKYVEECANRLLRLEEEYTHRYKGFSDKEKLQHIHFSYACLALKTMIVILCKVCGISPLLDEAQVSSEVQDFKDLCQNQKPYPPVTYDFLYGINLELTHYYSWAQKSYETANHSLGDNMAEYRAGCASYKKSGKSSDDFNVSYGYFYAAKEMNDDFIAPKVAIYCHIKDFANRPSGGPSLSKDTLHFQAYNLLLLLTTNPTESYWTEEQAESIIGLLYTYLIQEYKLKTTKKRAIPQFNEEVEMFIDSVSKNKFIDDLCVYLGTEELKDFYVSETKDRLREIARSFVEGRG